VLDVTRVLAGRWCTMTLADLGAEVWKIENPAGGDDTRSWTPPSVEGISTYFLSANRNKMSVAVDLKTPQGRAIVAELAAKTDVLVENLRPSSLRSAGLAGGSPTIDCARSTRGLFSARSRAMAATVRSPNGPATIS
jgi:crotonobetainyl-CoA:carnitine CoA-transferase CaiB-like acyl-CoA transferase